MFFNNPFLRIGNESSDMLIDLRLPIAIEHKEDGNILTLHYHDGLRLSFENVKPESYVNITKRWKKVRR